MRTALIGVAIAGLLGWLGFQGSVVQEKSYSLTGKASGYVLTQSAYPRKNFQIEVEVEYTKPGSILDTVGINAAPVGAWALNVTADERVVFGVWDGSKWHQLVSNARVAPGRKANLRVERHGETIQLAIDGTTDASMSLAVVLSGSPIFVGDFKGDEKWGEGYNIHQSMVGTVRVLYIGQPRETATTPAARVSDRVGLLSADEISALQTRIDLLEKEKGIALSFTFVGSMDKAARDVEAKSLYDQLYQASGKRPAIAFLISNQGVTAHYLTKYVESLGRDKLLAAMGGLPKDGRRVESAHAILDGLYGGGRPVDKPVDETPIREPRTRKPRRPITGLATPIPQGQQVDLPVGAAKVTIPPQDQPLEITTTSEESLGVVVPGLQVNGPVVAIQWEGSVNPKTFTPIVKFPASAAQLGANIVRVGDGIVEGDLSGDEITVLPTIRTKDGGLLAVDTFSAGTPDRYVVALAPQRPGFTTRYGVASYSNALNWKNEPDLVRMVPADGPFERQPIYQVKDPENAKIRRSPIKNVIVLVHGHNEYEKGGYSRGDASLPWVVSYKRDVWTLFWKTFKSQAKDYVDTTAVYEFIYPTYRPVFQAEMGVEPLALSFAKAIANDFDIAFAADKGLSFNLYIVAHSMGGLVSRTGINRFGEAKLRNTADPATVLEKYLDKVITWGSPHHGSPLVTMRYLLTGGYDIESAAAVLPLSVAKQSDILNIPVNRFAAMDTPGERALKWDNHRPLNLKEGGWVVPKRTVWESGDIQNFEDTFSLEKGSMLYNPALVDFNRNDRFRSKVVPFFGVTRKTIAKTGRFWKSSPYETITGKYNIVSRLLNSSEIGTGAWLITWLYQNQENVQNYAVYMSDGAVPVESAMGEGLFQRSFDLGDVDHEEYYGAPVNGKFTADVAAFDTSYKTLYELGFNGDKKGKNYPPSLELRMPMPVAPPIGGEAAFAVMGQLTWNGDPKPGLRVLEAQLIALDPRATDLKGRQIPCKLDVAENGAITGSVPAMLLPASTAPEKPLLRVVFKDKKELDSQASAGPDDVLPLLQKTTHTSATLIGVVEDSDNANLIGMQSKGVIGTFGMFGDSVTGIIKLASDYGKKLDRPNVQWSGAGFSFSIDTGTLDKTDTRANWGTAASKASAKLTITGRYDSASRALKDVKLQFESRSDVKFTADPNWRPRSTVESFYPPKDSSSNSVTVMSMTIDSLPLAGPPLKDQSGYDLYIAFAIDGKTVRNGIVYTYKIDVEGLNTTPQHQRTRIVVGPNRKGSPYETAGMYMQFALPKPR